MNMTRSPLTPHDSKYLPTPPVQLPQRTYKSVVSAAQGRIAVSQQEFQPAVVVERTVSACEQHWISQVLLGPWCPLCNKHRGDGFTSFLQAAISKYLPAKNFYKVSDKDWTLEDGRTNFCEISRFIMWFLSWTKWIHFTPSCNCSLWTTLIFFSYLCPCICRRLLLACFPTKMVFKNRPFK
jgi:hypothetical protein